MIAALLANHVMDASITMISNNWQTQHTFDAVVFDCDGTLTSIEGIDELARLSGVSEQVEQLTHLAMEHGQMDEQVYQRRLELVQPTQAQLQQVADAYIQQVTKHAFDVIAILQSLGKRVYIISAGLKPAVLQIAKHLNVLAEKVFAVEMQFDQQGNYVDFDHDSPLINSDGKTAFMEYLSSNYHHIGWVGDGRNDLAVKDHIQRFIGYGGAFNRKLIEEQAMFYIKRADLAPLLPLFLTEQESEQLTTEQRKIYDVGLSEIEQNYVIIRK